MDTKSKNRHKLGIILTIAAIIIPTLVILGNYKMIYDKAVNEAKKTYKTSLSDQNFLGSFLETSYILYNQEISEKTGEPKRSKEDLEEDAEVWMDDYEALYPYLDYRIEDASGKVIGRSTANAGKGLTDDEFENYAFGMAITYDERGKADVKIIKGDEKAAQSIALRALIDNWDDSMMDDTYGSVKTPKERTYIYGMTRKNIEQYLNQWYWYGDEAPDDAWYMMLISMAVVCVCAWIFVQIESLGIDKMKIFSQPVEIVLVIVDMMLVVMDNRLNWIVTRTKGLMQFYDILIWLCVFAITYWAAASIGQVFRMGLKRYVKERSLIVASWKYIKPALCYLKDKIGAGLRKIYHGLTNIDFTDKSSRAILRIVVINFIILAVTSLWVYGVMAMIVYSVILFFVLKKYFDDLKKKYNYLLQATNEFANGNLDVEIEENLGVFEPFKEEMAKIQKGFKKAVDEEVKSQHMKTELITNVSHDLKTPLTAIITYVNLLKIEKDPERQKEYIDVLDRKSLRLKALIEDLFEISKASSNTVTLNIADIDIVNLFKQVKLEMDEKIQEANLEFKMDIPEEKVIVALDGQKTYRIFENLIGNAAKYSMPHTRVYVRIAVEGDEAVVQMKNVSATELDFNPEEITERFVRGDLSRNTEGSGLGLAIVKSFTEIQKGKFWIETEADLFKAEIRWKIVDKKEDIA